MTIYSACVEISFNGRASLPWTVKGLTASKAMVCEGGGGWANLGNLLCLHPSGFSLGA